MELNYKGVSVLTRNLPSLRKNQLLKRLQTSSTIPSDKISGGLAFVLWVADLLAASGILGQSQQDLIFNSELGDDLLKFGELVSADWGQSVGLPLGHLLLMNRSFAAVTKVGNEEEDESALNQQYLNLNTGDMANMGETFNEPPIEVIHYNLTSLFAARMSAYDRLKKMPKPEAQYAVHQDQSD
jgi:hypothetical protein